jgi:hypothetical protein
MDTDKAEELLRSFYAMKTEEAKARGPHGGTGGPAVPASGSRRRASDRYDRLDGPRAALALAAAAFVMMAGFGFACQRWEARPISPGTLSLLAELSVGAEGLDRAIEAVRDSASRANLKGERL